MITDIKRLFYEALLDTDRDRALSIVNEAVKSGVTPEEIVFEVVTPSIEMMVKSISENFDASLAQHFITSKIGAEVTEAMIPLFTSKVEMLGRVVIGASFGDFHGLGKRIVTGCLKAMNIEVIDAGLNVHCGKFVEEAVRLKAQVIGISSMMVHTARSDKGCLGVRKILKEEGLEERIKVIVGGAPYRYDTTLFRVVQADAWADNGITAGKVIANLIREAKPW